MSFRLRGLVLAFFASLCFCANAPAQTSGTASTGDDQPFSNLRVLFSPTGGVRLFGLTETSTTPQNLLNPANAKGIQIFLSEAGKDLDLSEAPTNPAPTMENAFLGTSLATAGATLRTWGYAPPDLPGNLAIVVWELRNSGTQARTFSFIANADTFLGESSTNHFEYSDGTTPYPISAESLISLGVPNSYITSGHAPRAVVFNVPVKGRAGQVYAIAANEKRLLDEHTNFVFSDNRAFNLLPFSVNDSGLSFVWKDVTLGAAENCYFVLVVTTGRVPSGELQGRISSRVQSFTSTRDANIASGAAVQSSATTQETSTKPAVDNRALNKRLTQVLQDIASLTAQKGYRLFEYERLLDELDSIQKQLLSK